MDRRRVVGACSGFAGSAGGLCGAVLRAPLTAPRPAPRFTVHKNFSLQEQLPIPVSARRQAVPACNRSIKRQAEYGSGTPHSAFAASLHDLGHAYWQLTQNAH